MFRSWNILANEFLFKFGKPVVKHTSSGDYLALIRSPCAKLAFTRTALEIFLRSRFINFGYSAFSDPFVQLALWMKEAIQAKVSYPNAMTLSTVSNEGKPSAR